MTQRYIIFPNLSNWDIGKVSQTIVYEDIKTEHFKRDRMFVFRRIPRVEKY